MIVVGDCFDVLPTLDAESIDACVTDPPYGIGFMGREWDTFKPGQVKQPDRLVKGDPIVSDNPNLNGRRRSPAISPSQIGYDYSTKGLRAFQDWTEQWAREVLRVLKPGGYLLVCGAPRSFHRMTCGIEDAGFEVRDCLSWLFGQGFPKSLDVAKALDRHLGKPREVAGRGEVVDRTALDFGGATGKAKNGLRAEWVETAPNTDAAAAWVGWGTALKPGWEPVVMARKPLRGTVAANVERFGTGAINVDGCRLAFASDEDKAAVATGAAAQRTSQDAHGNGRGVASFQHSTQQRGLESLPAYLAKQDLGRWPANVVLDEEAAAMLDEQAGYCLKPEAGYGDSGGASRFFYVAKPSRGERDLGCDGLRLRTPGECTDRKEGTAGLDNPRAGAGRTGGGRNIHPTVKPLALMRWLVRLVTPPNGVVLDPFMGSGTTGMACAAENVGFIGIERELEYVEIAKRRILAIAPLFHDEVRA